MSETMDATVSTATGSAPDAPPVARPTPLDGLRTIADALPELVAYIDASGHYTFCNARFEEWFGLTHDAVVGQPVATILGTDAYETLRVQITAALKGERAAFDGLVPYLHGGPRHVRAEYVPDINAAGEVRGCFAIVTDVTPQLHAEEALRREEERYRSLGDVLPAHVVTLDASGVMESVNRSYTEYTGYTVEQARDYTGRQLIHPDDEPAALAVWGHALQTGEPMHNEMRLRRYDGEYRWHLVEGSPLRDASGEIVHWVTVSIDIDDRKRLEQERERWMHELERANAAKDEFLGLVSHELRTPITTIYGNAQVLRRSGDRVDEDGRSHALADIEAEADRLQRIIENMLILARVDAREELETEPLSAARAIDAVVAAHHRRFPSRPIEVEIPPDVPLVLAQRTSFEMIMRNLLGNAEKYSRRGTPIRVEVTREDDRVRFTVTDHCDGIRPEDLESIFTPFFRAARTKHAAAGAGIGLAVCRRLVEAQDGTIRATSDGASGCEFTFTLPADNGTL